MNRNNDESAAIVSRMRELRSTGLKDVGQLHAQADRFTNWREHVRAQPVLSAIAASLVGYSAVRIIANRTEGSQQVVYATPGQFEKRKSASIGLLSIASGMAASLARQWLTEYVKKQVGVYAHATNQPTNPKQSNDHEQRSHATS
jgi:hypothetical protein